MNMICASCCFLEVLEERYTNLIVVLETTKLSELCPTRTQEF